MAVIKPFYKESSFVAFLVGGLLASLGLFLSAQAILTFSANASTSVAWGSFLGMGEAFIIMGGVFRQQEKKLNVKTGKQNVNS